jgi:hypothetical protein
MRSVIAAGETQSVKARNEIIDPASSLIHLSKFLQQLLLQMLPASLFDRSALRRYPLLLCQPFAPRSWFHRLRKVPDLGPTRADTSLFRLCVRIHVLARPVSHKK